MTSDVSFQLLQRIAEALGVDTDAFAEGAVGATASAVVDCDEGLPDIESSLDLMGCYVEIRNPRGRDLLLRLAKALALSERAV